MSCTEYKPPAECVMLNKGPHILEAVQALDDIL